MNVKVGNQGEYEVGKGICLGALEVEAEDAKSPEPRRKAVLRWRGETAAAVVTAHGAASLSVVTTWA